MISETDSTCCPNCGAQFMTPYCHECGQKRIDAKLSMSEFAADIGRRVFRFDKALAVTIRRALLEPGALARDYLAGRRKQILDPFYYLFSSTFLQFVVASLVRTLAPVVGDPTVTHWLGRVGGVVAVRIFVALWLSSVWALIFRMRQHTTAETYVLGIYLFATLGLLLMLLPLIDVVVPLSLGANRWVVISTIFLIEWAYVVHGVRDFFGESWWQSAARATVVLSVGYGILLAVVGVTRSIHLLVPN
jgi:hypothetical protein